MADVGLKEKGGVCVGWVVRAGEAKARDLMTGYARHRAVPGLYGFSVQYASGASLDDLALSGRFPHAMISDEDEAVLANPMCKLF